MKKLENYTVLDILNMYKEILESEIEDMIYTIVYENDGSDNEFKQKIDREMENLIIKDESKYLEYRGRIAYAEIKHIVESSPELNNDEKLKKSILCEIFIRFSNTITSKEQRRVLDLILEEKSICTYKYKSKFYRGVEENEIITREKTEKLEAITDGEYRKCLDEAINETVFMNDAISIFKTQYGKEAYRAILRKLYINFFLKQNRMKRKQFNEISENDGFEDVLQNDKELNKEFRKLLSDYLCNNLQYIDKDMLLVRSLVRVILGIKIYKTMEQNETYSDSDERESVDFIKRAHKELKKRNCNKFECKISSEDGEELINADMEYIEAFLSRCTEDAYLTDKDIEEIHQDASEGKLTDDIEKRKIAKLNLDDLISANKNYEEKEDESLEKEKILESNIELAQYLLSEGITNKQEILECFIQGNINLELISNIGIEELTEEFFNDKFRNLYFEMVFSQESDEANKTLSKFSTLYSTLLKNNKISVNEDELIDDLLTVLGNEFAPEILSDLYDLGVITIEKGIEWVGADIFIEEYKKGKLKPQEVRSFYEENKQKHLKDIVRIINKLPDNGEKFMVIGSVFPEETEEDKETRELLFGECLKIENGIKNNNSRNKRKNDENKSNDYYKHITDPFARISLIKALDKDYSFEMTGDGHAIVKLPSFGKVIIEKMLNKNREPSYGAATYILDEKYYDDNKFRIKKDDKISRHEIIKDIESKKVTRIIHSVKTWGADIKEYFLQTKKVEWSENEIKVIDDAIGRVKRSDPITRDNQQLGKMILNLIVTRKATIEQVEKIAEIYGVDLGKVMDSLDER